MNWARDLQDEASSTARPRCRTTSPARPCSATTATTTWSRSSTGTPRRRPGASGTRRRTSPSAGRSAGQPLVGYYEEADGTVPVGVGLGAAAGADRRLGDRRPLVEDEPSDLPDLRRRGDKIACALCHDPHAAATGTNMVFFRTVSGDGTARAPRRRPRTRAGTRAPAPTSGERRRQRAHDVRGLPRRTPTRGRSRPSSTCRSPSPPTASPSTSTRHDTTTATAPTATPTTAPRGATSATATRRSVASAVRPGDQPRRPVVPGGAGAHLRHRDALGPAIFKCEICHGPTPGRLAAHLARDRRRRRAAGQRRHHGGDRLLGRRQRLRRPGERRSACPRTTPSPPRAAATSAATASTCHGDPPNTPGALNWTDDLVDEVTGTAGRRRAEQLQVVPRRDAGAHRRGGDARAQRPRRQRRR